MSSGIRDDAPPALRGVGVPWQPDDQAVVCHRCHEPFSFTRRKHHCRACGLIFDEQCSTQQIILPARMNLKGPQRVCDDCFSYLQDVVDFLEQESISLQQTLRMSRYPVAKILVDPNDTYGYRGQGPNPIKYAVLLRDTKRDLLLRTMSTKTPFIPFDFDKKRKAFFDFIMGFQHPFIAPLVSLEYHQESSQLHVIREYYPKGSLRDLVYKVPSSQRLITTHNEYDVEGSALSVKAAAMIGRQVLEALIFLKQLGYPFVHLHPGNILVTPNNIFCLSDIENSFAGLRPFYWNFLTQDPQRQSSREVVCFGLLFFEMVLARTPTPESLSSLASIPAFKKLPDPFREVLILIFPQPTSITSESPPSYPSTPPLATTPSVSTSPPPTTSASSPEPPPVTLEDLLSHPLFSTVTLPKQCEYEIPANITLPLKKLQTDIITYLRSLRPPEKPIPSTTPANTPTPTPPPSSATQVTEPSVVAPIQTSTTATSRPKRTPVRYSDLPEISFTGGGSSTQQANKTPTTNPSVTTTAPPPQNS
ncbi:PX domain-containing protein kinase-like protein [Pelomyxa schiedti]|nr:PX domain-containing protein kinase-like protein [Pelomyxa schiedti]